MSPDPLLSSGRPWDPQTWNRYAYTLNNPLRFTDPTGPFEWDKDCLSTDQDCQRDRQRFRDGLAKVREAANNLDQGSKERGKLEQILSKYGAEGEKNKVRIAFGDAGGALATESTSFWSRTKTVTFDLGAINRTYTNRNDGSDASIEFAGLVAHEGAHMLDFFWRGDPTSYSGTLRTETNAFGAQSYVNKAFNSYSPHLLWNPSWAAVDRERLRNAGVQNAAKDDADITWGRK